MEVLYLELLHYSYNKITESAFWYQSFCCFLILLGCAMFGSISEVDIFSKW